MNDDTSDTFDYTRLLASERRAPLLSKRALVVGLGVCVAALVLVAGAHAPGVHRYHTFVEEYALAKGLEPELVLAMITTESRGRERAVSPKGAIGLMQLMPDTARQYGVKNRFDVNQNLKGGISHLKYLYRKYNKPLLPPLAAYNAGEKAIKNHNGIPPYRETHNYIKRTMKYMGLHYSGYLKPRPRKKLFKYTTKEGRIVITDLFPAKFDGNVEIIE